MIDGMYNKLWYFLKVEKKLLFIEYIVGFNKKVYLIILIL